jgi:hypothetical protein
MKRFQCQACGQPLHFEDTVCQSCQRSVGYLTEFETMAALEPAEKGWRVFADGASVYRPCDNKKYDVCNWLVPADAEERFCEACRHNRTIPFLGAPDNLAHWRKIELSKHRLIYTLLRLGLPLTTRAEASNGLVFDFLAAADAPVMTGHADGAITINIAEADDAERERIRGRMGEPHRTLLGHFRHESGHYYWGLLVRSDDSKLDAFRSIFGDERQDYANALQQYYRLGPPADWRDSFVTTYASAHPWEDFAETWAHYLHIADTLETASAFGLAMHSPHPQTDQRSVAIDFDPRDADLARLIDAWLPMTFTVNSINRSMGLPDLYPFVLSPRIIIKLAFVHEQIHPKRAARDDNGAIRAVIAGLRRAIG